MPTFGCRQPAAAWRPLRRALGFAALLLLTLCSLCAQAYERDFYFQRIDSSNGLAQNSVAVIFQDSRGFIWLATQGGLHRYDGYSLRHYRHDPNRIDSLPDNLVTALADAGDGRLWVGSNSGGLVLFDPDHDRVLPLATAVSRPGTSIYALQSLPDGRLLIATPFGIDQLSPPWSKPRPLWSAAAGKRADVQGFARCPDGAVYAATADGVLALGAGVGGPRSGHTRMLATPPGKVNAIYCDHGGRLLLGDHDGLLQMDRNHGTTTRIWPVDPVAQTGTSSVTAIVEDHAGRLWLDIADVGLLRLDGPGRTSRTVVPESAVTGSLPEAHIATLFVDRSGLLWVGTASRGAAWTDPDGAIFHTVTELTAQGEVAGSNYIRAFYQSPDGLLWLGVGGEGIKSYDPATGEFHSFGDTLTRATHAKILPQEISDVRNSIARALASPSGLSAELRVYMIAPGTHGSLLLASNQGVVRLDPSSDSASVLSFPGIDADTESRGVRTLLRAHNGDLWLAPFGAGLIQYHDGQLVHHYRSANGTNSGLADDVVVALAEDRSGRIWAGTPNGVSVIDPPTGKVRNFVEIPKRSDSLGGQGVVDFRVAADGTIWVGTRSALNRLLWIDDAGAHFRRYGISDGLPDSTVYCMLEDARGMIWFSTNLGIGRLDPRDGEVRAYDASDGLQGDEYNSIACLRTHDGRLLFGGIHGFDEVDPNAVATSHYQAPVVITALRIGDKATVPPSSDRTTLDVAATARSLHVEFAALDYAAPTRNRFRYRLVGYDDGWIDAGNRHYATYTNLGAGDYRFEVQGSNRNGVFGDTATLSLHVESPWWWSHLMRALYLMTLAVIVLAVLLNWRGKRMEELRHQQQLRLREDRLRLALWGSGDEFWDWDLQAGMMFRLGADGLPGGHREESISADDWRNFAVHPDDLDRVEFALAQHVAGNSDHFEAEHRLLNPRGEWAWVISRGKIVERDAAGKPLRICGTARDISALRVAERDRRIAAEVIRSMTEAVTVTGLDFRFVSVNTAFTRMTGYAEEEVLGRDASLLNCRQHAPEVYTQVRQMLAESGHWRGELWQRRRDGEEFLCWVELNEVRDATGERTHLVGVLTDITDRKRVEQELRYLANYDTLTGLPNRTLLGERLGHAIIGARRAGKKVAVLFLDLDRFKHVNDSMGHAAGDRMLKAVGARLRQYVRERDTVARLGGDEFTVVLEDVIDVRDAEDMAQRLIEAFQMPLGLDSAHEVVISPSIGIALYPDHGQVPTDLLKYADTAMYQAKDRGRNTYAVYHARMDALARDRAKMIAALRRALERNEFALVYQPKMAIDSERITGVEALLRWRSAELGDIPPTVFIPLAEETGQIAEIGEFVLVTACADLRQFRDAGLRGLSMAVNLSAAQLERPELTLRMCEILAEHDIAPDQLELELTESMVMANAEQSVRILGELKSIGVHLAIDDFGTGYSSLAYLKRLPIDTLKIDQEFVGDVTIDPDDAAITATIITMAHSLGLKVIAEGVETEEQLAFLRTHGCDEIQGHWLSMPLPADACRRFIAARSERVRAAT